MLSAGKKDESKPSDADKSSDSKDKPSSDTTAEGESSKDEKKDWPTIPIFVCFCPSHIICLQEHSLRADHLVV